ncbi:hypothetical protein F7725_009694 [Dissostichus mawsoni]|uniref:Uncharacterized protein n=1 Tax=Dissostichus mawsoni TaxID=36200 RepID=A0A7J5XLE1_DISMA|nr:hypothetical protein F7725_009694 [Dissostichus mawsoni]
MKRHYPSGAQKSKMRAKAEQERAKLPKITSLFRQAAKVDVDSNQPPPAPAVSSESSRQPSSPVTAEPASRASRFETGQQEVSCAPSEASSDIGIAKAAQPASRAPTDPSSPVTAEPASRASRFETGQQEVSCAPSEASSDIAKVAQPASRAPTVTAAPTHPRDTLASDNSVTEYPTDRGKFPVDLEDNDVKRYILNNGPCKPEGPFKRDGKGSIKRLELLETHLSVPKAGQHTLKRLCPTQWASRQDAVQSLRFRYADIMQALTKIDLLSKKSEERAEATGLKKAMENLSLF